MWLRAAASMECAGPWTKPMGVACRGQGSQSAVCRAQPSLLTRADRGTTLSPRPLSGSERDRAAPQAALQGLAQPVLAVLTGPPTLSAAHYPLSPQRNSRRVQQRRRVPGDRGFPSPSSRRVFTRGQPKLLNSTLRLHDAHGAEASQSGRKYTETQAPLFLLILGAASLLCGQVRHTDLG